ncbi:MAG: hypothetical protein K2W96_07820, partial [Gemmataceae bacterium]|nr:hypothetical protein [Gemmataceae bacterium]
MTTVLMLALLGAAPPSGERLAGRALAVLRSHCHSCHGKDGSVEGGLNYVLDRDKLVARRKIVPGDPGASPLLKRVVSGKMPPAGVKHRPSPSDLAVLRDWIAAGAPALEKKETPRLVSESDVLGWILADLETMPRRERRFARCFSLVPLANAGHGPDELATFRKALAKLMNSLSWHPRITLPKPIDRAGLVLRIDLRDFVWDANLWNRLLLDYPYGVVVDTGIARAVLVATATRMPVVRGDWFVATASRAPLYYDLLQMPSNLGDLEKQLRVDAALGIQQERVARAGFNGSGVSRNNRVLERHDAMNGAYWRTYDFEAVPQNLIERNLLLPDRRNIFAYPLGPGLGDGGFQHAGGEAIFNLPNGLQAYYLVNAANQRLNKGPTEIVSDPRRPDRAVEAGLSCMHCHATGILPKDDQIRAHVKKNAKAFPRKDAEIAEALYPESKKMRKLMEEDAKRHQDAVAKTGNDAKAAEVVLAMALRHEADVDLATLAAEAGVPVVELVPRLTATENLARQVGALKVPGAVVPRQVVAQAFAELVREMRLGVVFQPGAGIESLPDATGDADPLEILSSPANAAAISPDGKLAALASADKTVRIIEVATGRDVRRCVGHTASVWAVAFSPDGTRLLSGSKDGTVRLWDMETARELARMEGHLDLVSAVAFSPDGRQALSAGYDHELILWDLAKAARVPGFASPEGMKYPHAVGFSPDGKSLLATSGEVALVMDATGKVVKWLRGHSGWLTAARFAGTRILTASDDGTARVWEGGKEVRRVAHGSPVLSVALGEAGLLTGGADSTLRLWDAGGKARVFRKHEAGVCAAAFSSTERFTLSVGRDAVVLPWTIGKDRVVAIPPTEERPLPAKELKTLRPEATSSIGGTVGDLLLSPKGLWFLDRTSGKVGRLDPETLRRMKSPSVEADAVALDGNGDLLALSGGKLLRVGDEVGEAWKLPKAWGLCSAPDGGFVLEDADEWADIIRFHFKATVKPFKVGTAWRRSVLRVAVDGRRLFVSSNGVVPGTFEAIDLTGVVSKAASDKRPLGGEFALSPDGKEVVFRNGTLLTADADLKPLGRIEPHLALAFGGKWAWLVARDGTLARYAYPEWKEAGRWRLPLAAYGLAVDGKRLYVAGFDARSVGERPRARGHGDIHL